MTRQMTAAANAEIAIGMKTTVLNATDQRTRSVRTAKISPIAVTNAGTISEPEEVVLDRGERAVVREQLRVVVEPDELVAAPVEEAAVDRRDRRVDDPDQEEESGGREEAGRQRVLAPAAGLSVGRRGSRDDRRLPRDAATLLMLLAVRLRCRGLHLLS